MLRFSECLGRFNEFSELYTDVYEIDIEKVKSLLIEKAKPVFYTKQVTGKESRVGDEYEYEIDLTAVLQSESVSNEVKQFFREHNSTAVKVTSDRYSHDYSAQPLTKAAAIEWVVCCHIPDVDDLEENLFPGQTYKDMSPEVLSWLDAYQEWRHDQYSKYSDYLVQAGGFGRFIQGNLQNYICQLNLEIGDGGSLYVCLNNGQLQVTLQMY